MENEFQQLLAKGIVPMPTYALIRSRANIHKFEEIIPWERYAGLRNRLHECYETYGERIIAIDKNDKNLTVFQIYE